MKTKMTLLLAMSVLAVAAYGETPGKECNSRSAVGAYGYSCTGVAPNPADSFKTEPFSAYGYVFGDGTGQWNGYGKVSFNGTVLPWTHKTRPNDPATVNPDCTGAVTYQVTVGGQSVPDAHFEFVVVDDGREIKGFPIDPGYAVSCQLILEK